MAFALRESNFHFTMRLGFHTSAYMKSLGVPCQKLTSLNLRTFVRASVRACVRARIASDGGNFWKQSNAGLLSAYVPVVCALSVVLRYPLLIAIATRYQFTDVAMPPIIETSGSSLTHASRVCGFASGLRAQCCAQVPLTHCHCNMVSIYRCGNAADNRNFWKQPDACQSSVWVCQWFARSVPCSATPYSLPLLHGFDSQMWRVSRN